jgi:hypothetical protein
LAADICKVDPNDPNVLGRIVTVRGLDCFGGGADKDPLAVRIAAIPIEQCDTTKSTDEDRLKFRLRLVKASQEVEAAATSLASRVTPDWAATADLLALEIRKSTNELRDVETLSATTRWEWRDHRTLPQANNVYLLNYEPIVAAQCPAGGLQECAKALAIAIEVNRLVNLTHHLHHCAGQDRLVRVRKRLAELDAAWDNYFFNTRSQYIWELGINSARFKGKDDEFAEPPVDQLIVAHPGISFEYVGGGAQNDEAYEAILMAELVGYNRFAWPERKDGKPSRLPPLGISLVGTYSPDNDGEHYGYGVMIHVKNVYSFGVARRDTGAGDETVYLLSADLMKLILKPSAMSMDTFRGTGAQASVENK